MQLVRDLLLPEGALSTSPGCSREGVEDVLLPNKGKLASYTVQYYPCPPPFKTEKNIAPYGIGLVEFETKESRLPASSQIPT
jgi:uncharacterized OB-fold protein